MSSIESLNKSFRWQVCTRDVPPFIQFLRSADVRLVKLVNLRATDNGTRAQRETWAGSVIDQAGAENTTLRAADPEAVEAHRRHASGFRVVANCSEGGARVGCKNQLHGEGVSRVGTTANYVEGGSGARRRTGWYRDERQVNLIFILRHAFGPWRR